MSEYLCYVDCLRRNTWITRQFLPLASTISRSPTRGLAITTPTTFPFTLLIKPASGPSTSRTTTLKKSLGDVNNGTHKINLTFSNEKIADTDTVTLNYLVMNSGHKSESQIYKVLEDTGGNLATKGLTAAGGALGTLIPIPLVGTALGAGAGWLVGELKSLLSADCDGPVAAGQIVMQYPDMVAKTAHGTFSDTTKHPGSDSPSGCGSNSVYYVTWFMQSH